MSTVRLDAGGSALPANQADPAFGAESRRGRQDAGCFASSSAGGIAVGVGGGSDTGERLALALFEHGVVDDRSRDGRVDQHERRCGPGLCSARTDRLRPGSTASSAAAEGVVPSLLSTTKDHSRLPLRSYHMNRTSTPSRWRSSVAVALAAVAVHGASAAADIDIYAAAARAPCPTCCSSWTTRPTGRPRQTAWVPQDSWNICKNLDASAVEGVQGRDRDDLLRRPARKRKAAVGARLPELEFEQGAAPGRRRASRDQVRSEGAGLRCDPMQIWQST